MLSLGKTPSPSYPPLQSARRFGVLSSLLILSLSLSSLTCSLFQVLYGGSAFLMSGARKNLPSAGHICEHCGKAFRYMPASLLALLLPCSLSLLFLFPLLIISRFPFHSLRSSPACFRFLTCLVPFGIWFRSGGVRLSSLVIFSPPPSSLLTADSSPS